MFCSSMMVSCLLPRFLFSLPESVLYSRSSFPKNTITVCVYNYLSSASIICLEHERLKAATRKYQLWIPTYHILRIDSFSSIFVWSPLRFLSTNPHFEPPIAIPQCTRSLSYSLTILHFYFSSISITHHQRVNRRGTKDKSSSYFLY